MKELAKNIFACVLVILSIPFVVVMLLWHTGNAVALDLLHRLMIPGGKNAGR